MGRIFFLSLLSAVSLVSLARPWVGVACAYLFAILTPQAVWYWNFDDLRPVMWILLPTAVGFVFALARGTYDLRTLRSPLVLCLVVLWACFAVSYVAGPFVETQGPYRFTDPAWAMSTLNKIMLLCLIACICVDDQKKLRALVFVIVVSAAYLVYWANSQYLSGAAFGRLAGPTDVYGVGTYADENTFAMLFVVTLPFLWYVGHAIQRRPLRWGLWLIIPFGWHAIFLTASRGGLIGVAVTILVMTLRAKHKALGLLLIPAFFVAYQWQGGDLMKSRAETISEFRTESSAASRLEAWSAAAGMVAAHPITGVGLASFGPAYPHFSINKPREAHNTLFQIAAESGLLAGMTYLLLVAVAITALWRNGNRIRKAGTEKTMDIPLYLVNEATLVALCGFVACSLFLSMQLFEVFYCLCALANAVLFISARSGANAVQMAADENVKQIVRLASTPVVPILRSRIHDPVENGRN